MKTGEILNWDRHSTRVAFRQDPLAMDAGSIRIVHHGNMGRLVAIIRIARIARIARIGCSGQSNIRE